MKKLKLLFVFLISVFTFTLTNNVFAEETYDPETKIKELNTEGQTISTTDHENELRFIGANPNNYVSFNGQKWRIIGVFDGRLKIIEDSIGDYSWDTSKNNVNTGRGVNQWGPSGTYTGADLMKLINPGYENNKDLKCNTSTKTTVVNGIVNCGDNTDSSYTTGLVNNSLWWSGQKGKCYTYGNYNVTDCDFTTSGLKSDTARNMIDNATWYLGSNNTPDENIWDGRVTASYLYEIERSNYSGKQCNQNSSLCNDAIDRTTTWTGKVGLLYPSDYAYATSGGSTYNRSQCLSYSVGNVYSGGVYTGGASSWQTAYTDCKSNDWLLDTSNSIWTISPNAYHVVAYSVSSVYSLGSISETEAMYVHSVRPVVYLKSNIKFTGGDGSINKPFELKAVSTSETNTSDIGSVTGEESTSENNSLTKETNTSKSNGTISTEKQVVKTGNTGINQSSLLIIIGSIMTISGLIVLFKKSKVTTK